MFHILEIHILSKEIWERLKVHTVFSFSTAVQGVKLPLLPNGSLSFLSSLSIASSIDVNNQPTGMMWRLAGSGKVTKRVLVEKLPSYGHFCHIVFTEHSYFIHIQ